MTPLEDYILDRMVEAQGLTVTASPTTDHRDLSCHLRRSLDREARAEADREVRAIAAPPQASSSES